LQFGLAGATFVYGMMNGIGRHVFSLRDRMAEP